LRQYLNKLKCHKKYYFLSFLQWTQITRWLPGNYTLRLNKNLTKIILRKCILSMLRMGQYERKQTIPIQLTISHTTWYVHCELILLHWITNVLLSTIDCNSRSLLLYEQFNFDHMFFISRRKWLIPKAIWYHSGLPVNY